MNHAMEITKELFSFIEHSPSCYHAVKTASQMLLEAGFTKLSETEHWKLAPGGKYFTVRSDSSLIAFRIPEGEFKNFQIIASHSDSPSFKIKENEILVKENHYTQLNVEKYGGAILSPWFDRPLSIAGRIVFCEDGLLKTRLVCIDRDLLMLPSLAIHMDRKVNEGHSYQIQKELMPILGDIAAKESFKEIIGREAGVAPDSILGTDLFLYNRDRGVIWGANQEFISAPRLDDLQCAFCSVKAITNGANASSVVVCGIFDNEEVGSGTKQGALSTFLKDTLERISEQLGKSSEEHRMAVCSGFMLSADNGHAVHPNFPEKADPTNRPYMNEGVLIKYNAAQKYTTDSVSAAIFKAILKKHEIPFQTYINHSDVPGGSTLGNLANTHVSLNTIDIGTAQLAMHSPFETAGVKDTLYLYEAMKAFYDTQILPEGDGTYRIL